MSTKPRVDFFYSPQTRAGGTLILLEELNANYDLHVLNMKEGEQRGEAYLAINPMGKVPAIVHDGALISEQVAVFLYLADLYPEAGLAPPIGDPLRGPYLRWMVFYASCFEPAVVDKAQGHPPAPQAMCPYGDFNTMMNTLLAQLDKGPYLLGDRFTAADVLWGNALSWITKFGLVEATPRMQQYIEHVAAREGTKRAHAREAELAAA
ncbi:glutathione S-transferase [Luteibacter sp. Sphag1AF]|uniref:glutathione S-transferase family protein n=1 Tax=Luteibacter sp. Sphag1AF TaxID=2587031 RepID=UPI00160F1BB2|nr:glutathione S-transferase family protein [Luteibacter sp. Sphag1AF]MBB3225700.1 glutathione S-transferase [Luteibacter sp. Sphag1AF]